MESKLLIENSEKFTNAEKELILINGYGHIGDGNLHINVTIPGHENKDLEERLTTEIEPYLMNYVKAAGGSVSAEHGIGF